MLQKSISVNVSIDPRIAANEMRYDIGYLYTESCIRICTQHIITSCNGCYIDEILPKAITIATAFELQLNFLIQRNLEANGFDPLTYGIGVTGTYEDGNLMMTWFSRDEKCQYSQDANFELSINPIKH